jgi:hypothetical protein
MLETTETGLARLLTSQQKVAPPKKLDKTIFGQKISHESRMEERGASRHYYRLA